MGKYKKSQILILSFIVVLLSVTPLLSSSIKATHLYFIINILIVAVGAEAGLLSAISAKDGSVVVNTAPTNTSNKIATPMNQERVASSVGVVKQSNVGKISTNAVVVAREVKICCSRGPSIFFISVGETEGDEVLKEEEGGEVGTDGDALAGQELSTKADTFISNFYKQMKMQREESQERFHGLLSKC